MKLDIILRTCQRSQRENQWRNEHDLHRICGDDREDMVLRCVKSLVRSINRTGEDVCLTILDDHSDSEFVIKLEEILSICNKTTNLVDLTASGPNYSLYMQLCVARDCQDLVYLVEDDYLHEENAIQNLISAYQYLSQRYDEDILIHPYDCPFRYESGKEELTMLYYDGVRYWRQLTKVAATFVTSSDMIKRNFDVYKKFAMEFPKVLEDDTFNQLHLDLATGQGSVRAFNPIPPIAYHLAYQPHVTINTGHLSWKDLWNR